MKKALLLLLVVGLLAIACTVQEETVDDMDHDDMDNSPDMNDTLDEESEDMMNESMNDSMEEPDVTIIMTGENFKFVVDGEDNPTIEVNQGDVVKIEFTSTDGFHDVVIDELGVASEKISTDETTSVTFTATEAGTFDYYCSVGQHRASGMEGTLIVN